MTYTVCFNNGAQYEHPLSKVVCVGRNYAEHAKELNNPVPSEPILFIKPESSVVSLSKTIEIPDTDCHYETEIAVLVGDTLSHASAEEAESAIAGLGLALDLTRRDLQSTLKAKSHPWEIAKAFDGACPLSDFVAREQFDDLQNITFSLHINGALRQRGNSADMLMPIIPLLVYISNYFTLKPGDVVLTGTPKGVGELHVGNRLGFNLMDKLHFETSVI